MNEEEIRGNLLLPFLKDLGFDVAEISLERSFTIRLGRHQHLIKGRADILCKRNGKNLFIIELKSDTVTISQNDIDQGISYARALDDIAPFTIITNGKDTRIFDTVTKLELTGTKVSEASEYWRNGCTLSMDAELRVRYEALKKFVSLSDENLQEFCKNQVQDRMGPIIGNIDSPSAKFVTELYIQRNDLRCEFLDFIDSQASAFGIVGSAGVGKTNAICSLALQALPDNFVFFYNAAIINKSPLEHMAQDLNGVFSSKSDSDTVLKKLDELGRFINKKILLFIDAIDESISRQLAIELSEIALAIRNLDHVKLCISCKDNLWPQIIKPNNNHTHLYEELSKFRSVIPDNRCPGYLLEDFSDDELKSIIPIYKEAFGFKGDISEQLLGELKNGFFLRIFSEVYSNKEIPTAIDDKHLINEYLKQSLSKTNIGVQPGLRILSEIGKVLINQKYRDFDFVDDIGVNVDQLLDALDYPLDKEIPEDLFARNILTKANKEDSYHISFYYSKIRDYIICFHTFKLDQLDDRQFAEILEDFYENYIGQSAIAFYIENATYYHQQVLIDYKKRKALSFVNKYNAYLEEHFKTFKDLFKPRTKGEIGIVFPNDVLKHDGYALYPVPTGSSEKIIYEDLRNPFDGHYYESRMFKLGVDSVYLSHVSLLKRDQDEVINKRIFEQLKDIIEKGRLNPFTSDVLLLEQVALVVYYYRKDLNLDSKLIDNNLPLFEQIYPIHLQDIQNRIKRFLALRFFQDRRLPQTELDLLIDQVLENKIEIPKLNISGDFPPFEILSEIIVALKNKGYEVIEKHHLPYPDRTVDEARQFCQQNNIRDIGQMRACQFTAPQAKLYIESFFRSVEQCYKEFVEYLFPTFKERFSFYKNIPHDYFFYLKDSDVLQWGSYGYQPSKDGGTKISFKEHLTLEQASKEDGIRTLRGFSLDRILHSGYQNRLKTFDKFNTSKVNDFCVLRTWVYELLKNDIRKILREHGSAI